MESSYTDKHGGSATDGRVARDVLAELASLEAKGKFLEAVSLATRTNREHRDPRLEEELVRLRQLAFDEGAGGSSLSEWPRSAPDLFPEHRNTLVELQPDGLTAETLTSAIVNHGSLLVRGMIPAPHVERLRDGIDHAVAMYDAWAEGMPASETSPWFRPLPPVRNWAPHQFGRVFIRYAGGIFTAESPRNLFQLLETFETTGVLQLIEAYLGERPALSARKGTLRRCEPNFVESAWHQDGRFLDQGVGIRALNAWLSLSHCGRDAPGLDVIARRLNHIVETGSNGAHFYWSVGSKLVEETEQLRDAVVRPIFEPGDILFFDELNLHRPAGSPDMSQRRYAIESWFFAPSKYPPNDAPLVV